MRSHEEAWALALEHDWIATQVVWRGYGGASAPAWDWEDLMGWGREGLFQAAQRWDESKGPFTSFAWTRVKGAIIDQLRNQQQKGRGRSFRPPEPDSIEELESLGDAWHPAVEDDPLERVESAEAVDETFPRLWAVLSPQQRLVMAGLAHGKRLHVIGEELGVSESRICQVRADIRTKWEAMMSEDERRWETVPESDHDSLAYGIWNKDDLLASPEVPAELRVSVRERLEHRQKNQRWGGKRAAVIKIIKERPDLKPAEIARRVGCHKSYVHTVRKEERDGEVESRRRAGGEPGPRGADASGEAAPEAAA